MTSMENEYPDCWADPPAKKTVDINLDAMTDQDLYATIPPWVFKCAEGRIPKIRRMNKDLQIDLCSSRSKFRSSAAHYGRAVRLYLENPSESWRNVFEAYDRYNAKYPNEYKY